MASIISWSLGILNLASPSLGSGASSTNCIVWVCKAPLVQERILIKAMSLLPFFIVEVEAK